MNSLNIKFQSKRQNISQLVGHIESFCKNLVLFRASLQRNDVTHFFSCSKLLGEGKSNDFFAFFEEICEISDELNDGFADFDLLKAKVKILNILIEVDRESQPPYLQLELY